MVKIEAKGKKACFTRPEFKVERVSYDTITPTAARGLLESVFWKPQFRYVVTKIEVLAPIKRTATDHIELPETRTCRHNPEKEYANDVRQTEYLLDVHYRISADIELRRDKIDPSRQAELNERTYIEQFERHLMQNRFYRQPCFGLQELWAQVSGPTGFQPLPITQDLGMMLHSFDYSTSTPRFWPARLEDGVIIVPPATAKEVYSVCS